VYDELVEIFDMKRKDVQKMNSIGIGDIFLDRNNHVIITDIDIDTLEVTCLSFNEHGGCDPVFYPLDKMYKLPFVCRIRKIKDQRNVL